MALTKAHNRMIENAVINVKDYGAIGSGAVDDSSAIQAAINAATAYSTVYLPEGIYKLESGITINKALTFRGDRSTITTDSGYTTGITVSSNKVHIKDLVFNKEEQTDRLNRVVLISNDDCLIENCHFIGNGTTVGEYGRGTGIQFGTGTVSSNNLKIINCQFKNYEFCIRTGTASNLVVDACYFSGGIDPTYAAANYGTSYLGDGIKCSLDNTDDAESTGTSYTGLIGLTVTNCVFQDMNRDGLDFYYRGSNITATGNIFRGSFNKCFDIKVIYTSTETSIPDIRQTRSISITGNQFADVSLVNYVFDVITTTDGTVTLNDANTAQAVVIDGNVLENVDGTILNITNSSFVSFTNNIVRKFDAASNEENVIVFTGSAAVMRQFDFSNNQIRIYDDAVDLGFIYAASGVGEIEHLKVSGNTYYGGEDDSFMITQNDGIKNFIISDNIVQGNIDTSGSFGGAFLTLTDVSVGLITNNVFQWCNIEGIRLDGAYNVRIENNIIGNCGQTESRKEVRLENGANIATTDHVYVRYNTLHDNGTTTEGVLNNATGADVVVASNDTF